MSTRYAVVLIPEPSFTARVYRARQLICGQYASWAAEMHMLHLALTDYFPCFEEAVESVSQGLQRIARPIQTEGRDFGLSHRGIATIPGQTGHMFLDFSADADSQGASAGLSALRVQVLDLLRTAEGAGLAQPAWPEDFPARIYVMQHANLPPSVFEGAVDFAKAVVNDLEIPDTTRAWQLMLVRFQSAAAGEDWSDGRWAADLSWNIVSAHPL
ncbi:MAG: hypothetical protein ACE5Q6_03655 [Dehalococcoidia bacterium]